MYPKIPVATLLYPFVGLYPEEFHDPRAPMANRFDDFIANGSAFLAMAKKDEADLFVFPFEWYGLPRNSFGMQLLDAFFLDARACGKTAVLLAYGDDYVELLEHPEVIVLQSNLERTKLKINHYAIPAFVEDLGRPFVAQRFGSWRLRLGLKRRPTISFCGFSGSAAERKEVIGRLRTSKAIKTRFILRERYFGGAWDKEKNGFDFKRLQIIRKEYVDNLYAGDYVLCVRGYGNYSARFYESLCAGQIPLFVDTDCALPYSDIIDYEEFIIRITSSEIPFVGEFLADINASFTDEEFRWRKQRARQVWLNHLAPKGFFASMPYLLQ
ncbi:exostosin domain-containing protein [Thiocapsa imhoffii]|nr:exostosin family protein [Thiocapsa imhoffii]